MKKLTKIFLSVFLVLGGFLLLASCSNVSQSYADKVNKAAENKEYITLTQAKEDLGDECFSVIVANSGVIYAVKGYKNTMTNEELSAKFDEADENTKFQTIIIAVLLGNCTKATYVEGTGAEIEAKIAAAMKAN